MRERKYTPSQGCGLTAIFQNILRFRAQQRGVEWHWPGFLRLQGRPAVSCLRLQQDESPREGPADLCVCLSCGVVSQGVRSTPANVGTTRIKHLMLYYRETTTAS